MYESEMPDVVSCKDDNDRQGYERFRRKNNLVTETPGTGM